MNKGDLKISLCYINYFKILFLFIRILDYIMKRLKEYIFESLDNIFESDFNDKGFSNYFKTPEDFINALRSDNKFMHIIFTDLKEAEYFVKELYECVNVPVNFKTTPLLFNVNENYVKIKRQYQDDEEIINVYNKYKHILTHKYKFGDGKETGTTKGNEYEYAFVQYSKEYILSLINKNVQNSIPNDQLELLNNLFNKVKVGNKTLKEYIIENKQIINPDNIVYHTGKDSTRRNTNGRIIKYENNNIKINFDNLYDSGNIIADVQYKLPNKEIINISLKDKAYQLSNLGMGKNTMNVYPFFNKDINDISNNNFKTLCDFIGIDYEKVYNNIHEKPNDNDKIIIDKKYYDNIKNIFICAIGSNYYMVNSNGHIYYIPDMSEKNSISIKNINVEYPSSTRKRININITFDESSDIIGSIQLAIRSKTGENGNFGFAACQIIWGNVKITVKQ